MKNVITLFILEEEYDSFKKYLLENFKDHFSGIINVLGESFKANYTKLHNIEIYQQMKIRESEEFLKEDEVYNFYYEALLSFTNNIKERLDSLNRRLYTTLYQKVANNIRSSGQALSGVFNSNNIFLMPQRTNAMIKILQKRNKSIGGRVLVIIDAIRNPYEAVFFKDRYSIKSVGWNTVPEHEGEKNQVHTRSIHAEENAFLQLSKYGGQGILGGYLFTTASPCELCAKKAYQLGIKKVYYIDPYSGISKDHIFGAGSRRPQMILFEGAIGRGFVQLYTQFMPFKDELAMLV